MEHLNNQDNINLSCDNISYRKSKTKPLGVLILVILVISFIVISKY